MIYIEPTLDPGGDDDDDDDYVDVFRTSRWSTAISQIPFIRQRQRRQ